MPSPFPGMDPYLEGPSWPGFHVLLIAELHAALVAKVRPKYVVEAERRVYVETDPDDEARFVRPDVAVSAAGPGGTPGAAEVGPAAIVEPLTLTLPMPAEHREAYLTIRLREPRRVVTVIEVLSPSNKIPNTAGRETYLAKRDDVLRSKTHLVELDLLRGGARLPTIEPLPAADYYAFVCRGNRRPRAEVYAWSLRRAMPSIPVPLDPPDPDTVLDLQAVFHSVYDRAGYDYSLDYSAAVSPPLPNETAAWAKDLLAKRA